MVRKPLYMPWREDDFQASPFVRSLNSIQKWIYKSLILSSFSCKTRPKLPNDDEQLWILSGCQTKKQWLKNKNAVLKGFTLTEENLLENQTVVEDWEREKRYREERSKSGKLGNKIKYGNVAQRGYSDRCVSHRTELNRTELNRTEQNGDATPLILNPEEEKMSHKISDDLQILVQKDGYDCSEASPSDSKIIYSRLKVVDRQTLIEEFQVWWDLQDKSSCRDPLHKFAQSIRGKKGGDLEGQQHVNVQEFADKISIHTKGEVCFRRDDYGYLAEALIKYGESIVFNAFTGFYADQADNDIPFAAHKFAETALSRSATVVAERERKRALDEQLELNREAGRKKSEAECQEAIKKAEADRGLPPEAAF